MASELNLLGLRIKGMQVDEEVMSALVDISSCFIKGSCTIAIGSAGRSRRSRIMGA